ncbi:MAG: hypothetical protein RLZZ65_566 [Bacteroidota bacterium]|jgi:ADP-ribose pyrophosphatase YjhB (NUDIX family)
MPQKYKVFLEQHWILFTDERNFSLENTALLNDTSLPQLESYQGALQFLLQKGNQICYSDKPFETMREFFSLFKWLRTAGALVQLETQDQFLWIERLGYFDLPKGKIEKGETDLEAAIREVQEETGLLGSFELQHEIGKTYHCYEMRGKSYLKENTWFALEYNGATSIKVQTEEGIEKAYWLETADWRQKLPETYPGLRELLLHSS